MENERKGKRWKGLSLSQKRQNESKKFKESSPRRFSGRIAGYVLAKKNEESNEYHSHITSLAVLRTHRNLGLATKLMIVTQVAMEQVYEAEYVSLHVRRSNRAAFNLYTETLGYKINDEEAKYYVDGEDAYDMRKHLKGKQNHHHHHRGGCCSGDAKVVETT